MVFLSEGNMKKQLYRVKQLADQKFAGAERTEMLNDDLVYKEKQVDALRQVCLSTCKQTRSCIQGQGTDGASIDKRLKKLPDFNLGSTMLECSGSLWEASILGQVLGLCGNLQIELAQHVLTYEVEVEKLVLAKYQEILETDIPNIAKQRKQLTKLTLDYDSAKTRYQQAVRQSTPTPANKIDSIKQEYDEAKQKVETCKDALATELYAVLAKETDLARCLYQLATSQADYHRRALQVLESSIPSIHNAIQVCHDKPVYGGPLGEHLEAADTKIAIPIEKCVCYLLEYGLEEEGILRIAGSSSKVKKLKNSFDVGIVDMHDYDPPVVAGAMKQYLRELPEPLMTFELYDDWMETTKFPDKESRLEAIQRILPKLPKANYDNLRYLIKFLAKVAASQDINKMSSQNLAIVIAINLIWSPDEDQLGMNMGLATTRSAIVDLLISHADELFPGEEEFFFSENQKVSYGEYPSISPPLATADDDDDLEVAEVNQLQVRENALETRRPSVSKNPFSNGSPKEGGSPKVTRKESPKAIRKEQKARKKPAPPVPPPPKESNEKATGDKMKSQVNSEEKPTVPSKPRHVRTASGVSLDLSRPSSSTSVSDAEGGSNSNLVKEHSTSRDGEDSLLSEPILRSNFRASLPLGLRVSDDPELKTASLRSVSQAASALKERSKSTFGPPDGVEVKDTQEGKVVEVTTPGVSNERADLDEGISNGKKASRTHSFGNHAPPERPPRPQLPLTDDEPHDRESKAADISLSPPAVRTRLTTELASTTDPTVHREDEKEAKKKSTARNAYVNLPPNLEALKSQPTISLEESEKQMGCVAAVNDCQDDCAPPERPKKYDKSKVVPPLRPEKSDRLRALIDSKTVPTPVTKLSSGEESLSKASQNKEKPLRPPPCTVSVTDKEKQTSAGVVPAKVERIYPVLTDLELSNADEGELNLSKLTVVSNSPTVESPGPPKRPPRPLQRDNKPPPPVAKPRSVFGVQANPEQTHL